MKLKLPKQLLLTLLALLTIQSGSANPTSITQADADKKTNWKVSKTEGEDIFNITEDVVFQGYSVQYQDDSTTGNIFYMNSGKLKGKQILKGSQQIDSVTGAMISVNSLTFSGNTMQQKKTTAPVSSQKDLGGGAAAFVDLDLSNFKQLNILQNTLTATASAESDEFRGGAFKINDLAVFSSIDEIDISENKVSVETEFSSVRAVGGAIYANWLRFADCKTINIRQNSLVAKTSQEASLAGGAIAVSSMVGDGFPNTNLAFNNVGSLLFTDNSVSYDQNIEMAPESSSSSSFSGGAIAAGALTFYKMNYVEFKDNCVMGYNNANSFSAATSGGAIFGVDIFFDSINQKNENENSILIEGNSAFTSKASGENCLGQGGAFFSLSTISLKNCGNILFKNNSATDRGGAICTPILTLSADYGDITFVGNTHQLTQLGIRNSGIANALYFSSSGFRQQFRARQDRSIFFYDPIDSDVVDAEKLPIYLGLIGSDYTGSVVFSGEIVGDTLVGSEGSEDYADRLEASKKSEINATISLYSGALVLKEGVTLGKLASEGETGSIFIHAGNGCLDISQSTLASERIDARYNRDTNSNIIGGGDLAVWKIGAGAKLLANTIDLSDGMAVDVAHYKTSTGFQDHGGMTITATSTVLGGNLKIADHADYYTDNTWSKQGVFTLFDKANAGATGDFDGISSSLTGSNLVEDPYQYKGEWSYEWVGTKLVAKWTPLGGITDVQPELEGNIISNSMWSSASNVKSLSNTALANANILRIESSLGSNFWVKGIGDFAYDDSSAELDGYSYQGGGYAAGADFKVGAKSIVGVAFGQLTGDNKSELYNAKIKQESMMGTLYAAHLQTLNKRNSLLWTLAGTYGSTDNSMNTHYSDGQNSSGSWNNNAYFVEAKMEWRISPEGKSWTYKPFIGVEYTDVSLEGFTETGDKARSFEDGKYKNLALPIGMGVEHQSHFSSKTWLNSLSLAYVPDVYREAPSTQATRLSNGFTWKDQGSKPSIHTLRASINSTLQLNAAWTAYAGYTFEAREGASYHNVNTGVSYSF